MKSFSRSWMILGGALALALSACAKQQAKAPETVAAESSPPAVSAPQAVAGTQANVAAASGGNADETSGVLVVTKQIVDACPALTRAAKRVEAIDPDKVWVAVLMGLTRCLNDGGLADKHILVLGPPEQRDIVRFILASRGAPMDHVVVRQPPGPPSERVEISVLPTP